MVEDPLPFEAERAVDDRAGFHLKSQSVFICVHPWFLFTVHKPVRTEVGESWCLRLDQNDRAIGCVDGFLVEEHGLLFEINKEEPRMNANEHGLEESECVGIGV